MELSKINLGIVNVDFKISLYPFTCKQEICQWLRHERMILLRKDGVSHRSNPLQMQLTLFLLTWISRKLTVPATSVATKPNVCTRQLIFNELVWIIKVLPHSSPQSSTLALTGALKWGTVWTSTSTGIGIVKGQSLNFQIYLIKNTCSSLTFHNSYASWGRSSYSTSF